MRENDVRLIQPEMNQSLKLQSNQYRGSLFPHSEICYE